MFHTEHPEIAKLLLTGNFGIERETLRVKEDGRMSHLPHPFNPDNSHIVRDFCENQVEINTSVKTSTQEVFNELKSHHEEILDILSKLPEKETVWLSSNPPFIENEEDIPVAKFFGKSSDKTAYREYLSNKYGRYKMAFSGIHFNYSFSGNLLRKNFEIETGITIEKGKETPQYRQHCDNLYLNLAENSLKYAWIIVALTAASPLLDGSFFASGAKNTTLFSGMSSVRCSELGYWNFFVPTLDYSSINNYADSIERYVKQGLISAPSELYYPIRLKPKGKNLLSTLRLSGINHIELRSIDLNPLTEYGININDIDFFQLFLTYIASTPYKKLSENDQVQAVQNIKSAAHFDIINTKILYPMQRALSIKDAVFEFLDKMQCFFSQIDTGENQHIFDVIDFQRKKFSDPENFNYARLVLKKYSGDFAQKTLKESILNRERNV